MHADEPAAGHDYPAACPFQRHTFTEKCLFRGVAPIIICQLPVQVPEVSFHLSGDGYCSTFIVNGSVWQVTAENHAMSRSLRLDTPA